MPRLLHLVLVLAAVGALPAAASVAVAVTTPDQNVRHREVAAGLVEALQGRWAFVVPPLAPDDLAPCAAEVSCLHRLAQARGADWLLTVGVAGVGARGAIVTMQLVGPDGVTRFDDTAVLAGSADPRADGRRLADRLLAIAGPPPVAPVVERTPPPSPLPQMGALLVGGGAAVVGLGAGLGATLAGTPATSGAALGVVIGCGAVGVASAAVGAVMVAAVD
jgi:hypothetical protein